MKRIYALATALILLMALAIVGWGAWLNYSDEHQIAKRMANRSVELTAARAARRPFAPVLSLDALRFSSEAMADACDTYQFKDYSKYESSIFDPEHKAKVREEIFPQQRRAAYELGKRLVGA